jgi:hypothetical protein
MSARKWPDSSTHVPQGRPEPVARPISSTHGPQGRPGPVARTRHIGRAGEPRAREHACTRVPVLACLYSPACARLGLRARRGGASLRRRGRGGLGGRGGRGGGRGRRRGGRRCGGRRRAGRRVRRFRAALPRGLSRVSPIEARAFEGDPDGADHTAEGPAALRAHGERLARDGVHRLEAVVTLVTGVVVPGHAAYLTLPPCGRRA